MRTFKKYCMRLARVVFVMMLFYTTVVPKTAGLTPGKPIQMPQPQKPAQLPIVEPLVPRQPVTPAQQRFTQTEAYLEVPGLRDQLKKTFTGNFAIERHMDIVSRVLAKEAELRNTHWSFYHGVTNIWTVWQDTYTELFKHFNPSVNLEDADFIFLRTRGQKSQKAKDFLVSTLRESGLVDDNGEAKAVLLSVNITLFGNTHFSGESTWKYTMTEKSHTEPDRALYESIMDDFGLPYTYVNELMSLVKLIETKEQTLLQICVPKSLTDDVSYLAWTKGIPAHGPSIEWVKHSGIKGKGGNPAALSALEALQNKFQKEKERNPLFKEMLEMAQAGAFSVDAYLKKLCSNPMSLASKNLAEVDGVQARLVFTDEILLNPRSGVKMFRYSGVGYRRMKEYKRRLREIIQKTIAARK